MDLIPKEKEKKASDMIVRVLRYHCGGVHLPIKSEPDFSGYTGIRLMSTLNKPINGFNTKRKGKKASDMIVRVLRYHCGGVHLPIKSEPDFSGYAGMGLMSTLNMGISEVFIKRIGKDVQVT